MKKLLALVLALVMTLGLATVGSNAAISDFKDANDIKNEEAVAVMNAIGVLIGDENGFRPGDKLTRAEAAKIVAYLLLGNKTAETIQATGTKFTDVPASHWAAGYIEYLASEGVIAGVGDNKFDPSGKLTTNQFAKMLLVAVGFKANYEGLVGADWAIYTQKLARQVGLFEGNEDAVGTDDVTRDEAALYAFNTIKTPLREYDNSVVVNLGDGNVSVGNTAARFMTTTSTSTRYDAISAARENSTGNPKIIEFAEQYYPGLVRTDDTDDFGRPTDRWAYNTVEIGNYVNKSLFVKDWNTTIYGGEIFEALGSTALQLARTTREVYVDGVVSNATANTALWTEFNNEVVRGYEDTAYSASGRGVLTELYFRPDDTGATVGTVTLVVVNTYFAEALADYNTSTKALNLGVYETAYDAQVTRTATVDETPNITNAVAGDPYLVHLTRTGGNVVIREVLVPELVEDVAVSAYTRNSAATAMTSATADGTKRSIAAKCLTEQAVLQTYALSELKGYTYDLVLDEYDNIIAIFTHSTSTNFVFVTGTQSVGSNLGATTFKANLIWMDGTMETADVSLSTAATNDPDTVRIISGRSAANVALTGNGAGTAFANGNPVVNSWFTYTKDESGKITLGPRYARQYAQVTGKQANADISADYTTMTKADATNVFGNDKTTYITVGVKNGANGGVAGGAISEVNGVTVGIKNTAIETAPVTVAVAWDNFAATGLFSGVAQADTYFMYNANNWITGAIVIGEDSGVNRNFIYVTSNGPTQREYTTRYLDTYRVITEGAAKTDLKVDTVKSGTTNEANKLVLGGLYQVSYDADGVVVNRTALGVTPRVNLNTPDNKTRGYAIIAVGAGESIKLSGNAYYIVDNAGANAGYVLIDSAAKFFVEAEDGSYVSYPTASSALSAATASTGDTIYTINKVSAVVDGKTGYATTVVFDLTFNATTTTYAGGIVSVILPTEISGITVANYGFVTAAGQIVVVYAGTTKPTDAQIGSAIKAKLTKEGFTYGTATLTAGTSDAFTAVTKSGTNYGIWTYLVAGNNLVKAASAPTADTSFAADVTGTVIIPKGIKATVAKTGTAMTITGDLIVDGTLTVPAGQILNVTSDLVITSNGHVKVEAGGTLNVTADTYVNGSSIEITGGTFTTTNLEVVGKVTMTGATSTLTVATATSVDNGASITIVGTANLGALTNEGTVSASGATTSLTTTSGTNDGTISVDSVATANLTLTTNNATIEVENSTLTGTITTNSATGNIVLDADSTNSATVSTNNGTVANESLPQIVSIVYAKDSANTTAYVKSGDTITVTFDKTMAAGAATAVSYTDANKATSSLTAPTATVDGKTVTFTLQADLNSAFGGKITLTGASCTTSDSKALAYNWYVELTGEQAAGNLTANK